MSKLLVPTLGIMLFAFAIAISMSYTDIQIEKLRHEPVNVIMRYTTNAPTTNTSSVR